MANFKKALDKVLKWEGGWSDNPKDSGGATMMGITLNTFRHFFGVGKTKEDLRNITREELEHIYRKGFWDYIKGDSIKNQSLAELIFDFIVNSGVGKIRSVQLELNLKADGIVGNVTLAKLNNYPKECFEKIWAFRERFYNTIGVGKNSIFLRGWKKRLNSYKYEE